MWQRWALVLALGSTMIADRPEQAAYQTEPYLPECNVAWPDVAPIYIPAILLSR